MTGLDKILNKIAVESEQKCTSIIKAANAKAAKIEEESVIEAEKRSSAILADAKNKCATIAEMATSAAQSSSRQELLRAKIEEINSVIDETIIRLRNLDTEEYSALLLKLLGSYAAEGECEFIPSFLTSEKLSGSFISSAEEITLSKGCRLSFPEKTASVPDGFILRYGDIEINCSFEAIIDSKRDYLKEEINTILFQAVNDSENS